RAGLYSLSLHDALPIYPELAGERLARGLDEIGQFLGLAQQAVGLGDDRVAERGEADHAAAALDQRHAEQRFELADAGGEGRLREDRKSTRLNSSHVESS